MKKRIGVLLSGRGSNFEALADSVAAGRIPDAEIAIVISNRENAPGIEKARAARDSSAGDSVEGTGARSVRPAWWSPRCEEKKVDLVCLAGYMRLLSPYFVAAFPGAS